MIYGFDTEDGSMATAALLAIEIETKQIGPMEVFVPSPVPATPPGWRVVDHRPDGWAWQRIMTGHTVILSGLVVEDRPWLHLSIAHPSRLPRWDELVRAKEAFLGAEVPAYQVLAPRSEWYNAHLYCLHLWSPLPDFTLGGIGL